MPEVKKVEETPGEATAPVEETPGKATVPETPKDIRSEFTVEGSDGTGTVDLVTEEPRPALDASDGSLEEERLVPEVDPKPEKTPKETKPKEEIAPKHKTAEERFADLTDKRYKAEAEAKLATDRYNDLLKKTQATAPVVPVKKEDPLVLPKMPTRASVEFDDDAYAVAMDKYQENLQTYQDKRLDQRFAQRDVAKQGEDRVAQAQEQENEVQAGYNTRVAKFSEEHSDYKKVVHGSTTKPSQLKAHKAVLEFIRESTVGPEIAYRLATHPEEAEKLLGVTPMQALVDIGKMQVSFKLEEKKKTISNAPDPIVPINGPGDVGSNDLYSPNLPIGDFMQRRTKKFYGMA